MSDKNTEIDFKEFEVIKKVIGNVNGIFYQIKSKKTQKKYTEFIFSTFHYKSIQKSQLVSHLNKLMKIECPSILSILKYNLSDFQEKQNPTIISDCLVTESLGSILYKNKFKNQFNNTKRYINAIGICYALKWLHDKDIIYQELCPNSILLDENYYPHVCIFHLNNQDNIDEERFESLNKMYLAPEIFEEFHFSDASSSFAFAIILYQLIPNRRSIKIGRLRYACYNDLSVDDLSNEIQSYFINSLDTNPLNRPTIDQIYDQLQTDDFRSAFGDINEEEVTKYIAILTGQNEDYDEKSESHKSEDSSNTNTEESDDNKSEDSDYNKSEDSDDNKFEDSDDNKSEDSDDNKNEINNDNSLKIESDDAIDEDSDSVRIDSDEEPSDGLDEIKSENTDDDENSEENNAENQNTIGNDKDLTEANEKVKNLEDENKILRDQLKLLEKEANKGVSRKIGKFKVLKALSIESKSELFKVSSHGIFALKVFKKDFFKSEYDEIDDDEKEVLDWDYKDDGEIIEEVNIDKKKVNSLFDFYKKINALNHPNIIKSYDFYHGDETHLPYVQYDYYPRNLKNSINRLDNNDLCAIVYEVSKVMEYLHSKGINHLNLRPENILLDSNKHIKLTDFRSSTVIKEEYLEYVAPEVLKDLEIDNNKVDVYSFGILSLFIFTRGHLPKFNLSDIVHNMNYLIIPDDINQISNQLIESCCSNDTNDRLAFEDIVYQIETSDFQLIDDVDSQIIKEHLSI